MNFFPVNFSHPRRRLLALYLRFGGENVSFPFAISIDSIQLFRSLRYAITHNAAASATVRAVTSRALLSPPPARRNHTEPY